MVVQKEKKFNNAYDSMDTLLQTECVVSSEVSKKGLDTVLNREGRKRAIKNTYQESCFLT